MFLFSLFEKSTKNFDLSMKFFEDRKLPMLFNAMQCPFDPDPTAPIILENQNEELIEIKDAIKINSKNTNEWNAIIEYLYPLGHPQV